MRRLHAALVILGGLAAVCPAALAQERGRGVDPNINHFYMARQEIQILDDGPAVNDMRSQPGAPGANKAPAPSGRQALPHAGFVPYSQTIPSLKNSLPSVYTGVPPKGPVGLPGVNSKLAKAGAYKGNKPAAGGKVAGAPVAPALAKTYAPYKGYGTGNTPAPASTSASSGGSASTSVQGSLMNRTGSSMLHWSRTH